MSTRILLAVAIVLVFVRMSLSGEVRVLTDPDTGWELYELSQGSTVVRLAPDAGANVYSIKIDGVEYLRQPETLDRLPGAGFGNPILYPTPNRVKDAMFEFGGKTYRFEPNAGKNFIHGLVNRQSWELAETTEIKEMVRVRCDIKFKDGDELHKFFPFPHTLRLWVTVKDRFVRWEYEVDNTLGKLPVPFGFALHPYFMYQGSRENTFLTIPATHWMESEAMLPSGKLIPAAELDFPLGEPMSLAGTKFDDVFFGMLPYKPTLIEFRDKNEAIKIRASKEFTHLVVWTPERPYFGIESQTCSTDAHNLDHQGHKEAAHLQVCPPRQGRRGWVEYRFIKK